jgi:DNA/RNA endonuclease YhcR with UshA esterase domain
MNKLFLIMATFVMLVSISSCVKDNYDHPDAGGKDPDIKANTTIAALKALYNGVTPYQITDTLVIEAIVTADDQSGNLYKSIVIQDSTGGISLLLEGTNLYTDYPVGRRLFIKCKDLVLSDYAGLIQLGGYIDQTQSLAGIPPTLFDKYVLKGTWGHTVLPKVVSISQLNDSYQNELIELNDVEFTTADAGKTYADAVNKVSLSRNLKNCSGGSLVVRTSGYASFANKPTPTGNGKLLAIYTVFNSTGQLVIRDLNDVHMDSVRCGGNVVSGPGIASLRALYQGSDVTIPAGTSVTGIVIADPTSGNLNTKSLYIQDSLAGINLFFSAAHSFHVGDKVTADLSGLTLTLFGSSGLEVTGVPLSNVTVVGSGSITPRVVTTAQVAANINAWEATLLKIDNATLTGGSGGTFSGNVTITDATGTLILYTKSAATFSGTTYPVGNVSVTGYLVNFNGTPELQLRSAADVQ